MIKKTIDFVKNWSSNSNLCFEKHWFSNIFDDEKLSVFNFWIFKEFENLSVEKKTPSTVPGFEPGSFDCRSTALIELHVCPTKFVSRIKKQFEYIINRVFGKWELNKNMNNFLEISQMKFFLDKVIVLGCN